MTDPAPLWQRLDLALRLLAVDPAGLGGLWLRARSGPVRDRVTDALPELPLPLRRIHPGIADEQLFGGVDLTATLAEGRVVRQAGLLARPATLVLTMAERCAAGLAARLSGALDGAAHLCLIALDEGVEADETLPSGLADRLAFQLDLDGLAWGGTAQLSPPDPAAHDRLAAVTAGPEALADLARVAARLGIDSLRAPLLALRAARAHAALMGRNVVGDDDLRAAVELVFAPRATQVPEQEREDPPEPEPDDTPPDPPEGEGETPEPQIPEEVLLEAAKALLPADLLARIAAGKAARAAKSGAGAGAVKKGNRRGRPLTPRAGRIDGQAKIDLVATLRAAAPWQPLRRKTAVTPRVLHIRPEDIRLRRYEEKSDRLLIFTVDASGSAALARLAEAKGAVEMLLTEAYARRDHVALVAFRGQGAELLLPPTRSLVQTKRRLAALPGGGGTPLAAGLRAAMEVAGMARGRGMTPTIALLTDGRANIALDGSANRTMAAEDATMLARALRVQGTPGIVIDTGVRPEAALSTLAGLLGAPYLALPRADAGRISAAVSTALEG